MNDLLFAGVTLSLLGGWAYLRRAVDSESLSRALPASPKARFRGGLRWLMVGHLCSLGAGVPVFAYVNRTMDPAEAALISTGGWILRYLSVWVHWTGLVQAVYVLPGPHVLQDSEAVRGLRLGARLTLAFTAMAWFWDHRETYTGAGACIAALLAIFYIVARIRKNC